MLHSLHDSIIYISCVQLVIVLLYNETLISDGPLVFNFWDHRVGKHLCRLHPVDAGNAPCFHCTRWTILADFFCRIFENERPDANIAIEMTIGMTVPSRTSNSTHEHNFRNVTLTFARLMWWCLTRNEVAVNIDLCQVEPLFIYMYIVINSVKTLIPRIHEGFSKI